MYLTCFDVNTLWVKYSSWDFSVVVERFIRTHVSAATLLTLTFLSEGNIGLNDAKRQMRSSLFPLTSVPSSSQSMIITVSVSWLRWFGWITTDQQLNTKKHSSNAVNRWFYFPCFKPCLLLYTGVWLITGSIEFWESFNYQGFSCFNISVWKAIKSGMFFWHSSLCFSGIDWEVGSTRLWSHCHVQSMRSD